MDSWNRVKRFYEDLVQNHEWNDFAVMDKFIKLLIANRNLEKLYAHTSHEILVITNSDNYKKWSEEPKIFVELNLGASEDYLYKFSYVEQVEDNEIIRIKQENILCSFEKSLEVFDEMVDKLKAVSM